MPDYINWFETDFCGLESQTNVYTMCKISNTIGLTNKVVVSSIDAEMIAIEYPQGTSLQPSHKKLQFTYLPGDAEIVSIDSFVVNQDSYSLVVAVTFLKISKSPSPTVCGQYLNIYCQPDKKTELDSIAENCQHIVLDFIPFQLTHASILRNDVWENVLLLSGSDCKIHVYTEDPKKCQFEQINSTDFFPEFTDFSSCVVWLDIKYTHNNGTRLTAIGEQNGQITLFLVNVTSCEIMKSYEAKFDGPITSVNLFTDNYNVSLPDFVNSQESIQSECTYHLLVTPALQCSLVYRDVIQNGLKNELSLHGSDSYDIAMCACSTDVDFDGENELLIGTYGQALLAYKFHPSQTAVSTESESSKTLLGASSGTSYITPTDDASNSHNKLRHKSSDFTDEKFARVLAETRHAKSQEDMTDTHSLPSISSKTSLNSEDDPFNSADAYRLLWRRHFTEPVMAIDTVDLSGDGIDDIVIASLKGFHVLQPDLLKLTELCEKRLLAFKECTVNTS